MATCLRTNNRGRLVVDGDYPSQNCELVAASPNEWQLLTQSALADNLALDPNTIALSLGAGLFFATSVQAAVFGVRQLYKMVK